MNGSDPDRIDQLHRAGTQSMLQNHSKILFLMKNQKFCAVIHVAHSTACRFNAGQFRPLLETGAGTSP